MKEEKKQAPAKKNKDLTHAELLSDKICPIGKRYGLGGNLWLTKTETRKGKWTFRYKSPLTHKAREMGFGTFPDIGLALAREKATDARRLLFDRKDPLEERRKEERERQRSHGVSFEEAADRYILAKSPEWKGGREGTTYRKHRNQLKLHAFPIIGQRPIAGIDKYDILKILQPILDAKKGRTARKLQEYLKSILDYAKAHNWREGDNPAEWKGNLEQLLPEPEKIAPVQHHKALKSEQMPVLMKALGQSKGTAALAAQFVILTATRSGEGRKASWSEIDFKNALWTIPMERMKAGNEHIVTLSTQAIQLLNDVRPLSNGKGLIFPNSKNKPLSDVMLLKAVKQAGKLIGEPDITLHGLRATFRTWVGEETDYSREAAEHALSHVVGGGTERAYSRGTMEEKRRPLMEDWGQFCMGDQK